MNKIISILPLVIGICLSACDWHFQDALNGGDMSMSTLIDMNSAFYSDLANDQRTSSTLTDLLPAPDLVSPDDCGNSANSKLGFCAFACTNCNIIEHTKKILNVSIQNTTAACQCVLNFDSPIFINDFRVKHVFEYNINDEDIKIYLIKNSDPAYGFHSFLYSGTVIMPRVTWIFDSYLGRNVSYDKLVFSINSYGSNSGLDSKYHFAFYDLSILDKSSVPYKVLFSLN